MKPEEILTDEEISIVHANAHFGDGYSKRDIVNLGVLKVASGFYQGYTSKSIVTEHGLIDPKKYELTAKGREYLWAVFSKGDNF